MKYDRRGSVALTSHQYISPRTVSAFSLVLSISPHMSLTHEDRQNKVKQACHLQTNKYMLLMKILH